MKVIVFETLIFWEWEMNQVYLFFSCLAESHNNFIFFSHRIRLESDRDYN